MSSATSTPKPSASCCGRRQRRWPVFRALLRYIIACEDGGDTILETYMDDDVELGAFERTTGVEVLPRTLLTALERL